MSTKDNRSLGEIIKEDLKSKGINGSAVARKMKVARQVINQIDRRKKFDIDFLLDLKEASGLDYTRYALDHSAHNLSEPPVEYQKSKVTLTINIACPRELVNEFSKFLADVELVSDKYGFQII